MFLDFYKKIGLYALLLFAFGCKVNHQEAFVIRCKFAPGTIGDNNAALVVTDRDGNILKNFIVYGGSKEFTDTLQVEEGTQFCHLNFGFNFGKLSMISYLDVSSGDEILVRPYLLYPNNNRDFYQKGVRVNGIQSLDSLGILGGETLTPGVFWPEQMQVFTSTPCYNEQGIVLHGKANGVQDYQYLYLPSSIMSQVQWNYETQWSLFSPVPAPIVVTKDAALPPVNELLVEAVAPGFNEFVRLGPGTHIDPEHLAFIRPDGVPALTRIRLNGADFATEKIFQPGDPLHFNMTNMQIGNISSTPGKGFKVESSGDIDVIELVCDESTYYSWTITGRPESFTNAKLPAIRQMTKYIGVSTNVPTPFWRFTVVAHHFGNHNFQQVMEGFPYNRPDFFPVAQSGYFMVKKYFE